MAMTKLILLAVVAVACVSASYNTNYHQPKYTTVKQWSAWGAYGECSVTCGGGEQKRYRSCDTKKVHGHGYGNTGCYGPASSMRRCNQQCCPVDGGFSDWSAWSPIDYSYKQTRTRSCSKPYPSCGGAKCYGETSQSQNVHRYAPKPHYYPKH